MVVAQEAVGGRSSWARVGVWRPSDAKSIDQHSVEIPITLALVMGGYAVADAWHRCGQYRAQILDTFWSAGVVDLETTVGTAVGDVFGSSSTTRNIDRDTRFWEFDRRAAECLHFSFVHERLIRATDIRRCSRRVGQACWFAKRDEYRFVFAGLLAAFPLVLLRTARFVSPCESSMPPAVLPFVRGRRMPDLTNRATVILTWTTGRNDLRGVAFGSVACEWISLCAARHRHMRRDARIIIMTYIVVEIVCFPPFSSSAVGTDSPCRRTELRAQDLSSARKS